MAITKTIGPAAPPSDYAADNTGVVDATPAFNTNLKPAMAGQDCNLTVVPGTYNMSSSSTFWASGMTSLNATMTGVTLNTNPVLGTYHLAQIGIDETSRTQTGFTTAGGQSARIQTAQRGATSVALTTTGAPGGTGSAGAGHISRAVVGQWMVVTGFDIQGLFLSAYGFPPNTQFVEFRQITAVDTTNKIISFTTPLRDFYSSEWPELNRGASFEVDSGGPATVFFLSPDFGATAVFEGGTYSNTNLIICTGKDFTIRNAASSGGLPFYPSSNVSWRAFNCDTSTSGNMEMDKFVETALFDGGHAHGFETQSGSINSWTLSNTTIDGIVNGTARNALIDTCVIGGNLNIGPSAYGRGETLVCRNTSIAGTIGGGINVPDLLSWKSTMVNGVFTVPLSNGTDFLRMLVPDASGRNGMFFTGDGAPVKSFRILSVTSDRWPAVDNVTSTTNVTMAFNSTSLQTSTSLFASGDVGKVILIGNAGSSGGYLKTVITVFTSATQVTVRDACLNASGLSASSQTVQFGTCNAYIQTDQPGGFPPSTVAPSTGKIGLTNPPVRTVSFENCTGSDHAVDLSQAAARNRPLWSYTKRTYNGLNIAPNIKMVGNLVSIKINVTTPYTGALGSLFVCISRFENYAVIANGTTPTSIGPKIDLKVAGERILIPGLATTGGKPNDTGLTMAGGSSDIFLKGGGIDCYISGSSFGTAVDISGESSSLWPSFTMEIITDQGAFLGPTAVAPLRLRLHA